MSSPSILSVEEAEVRLYDILHKNLPENKSEILPLSTFEYTPNMPVIDPEKSLEQCMEWEFVVELLNDILADEENIISQLNQAIQDNSNEHFHKAAHALKGAALNLHLPGLVDISRKTELLGKQLEDALKSGVVPQAQLADHQEHRKACVGHMQTEYKRLKDYMPEVNKLAEEEAGQLHEEEEDGEEEEEQEVPNPQFNYASNIDTNNTNNNNFNHNSQSGNPALTSAGSNSFGQDYPGPKFH
jgi:HPt (histidine-containing phosphotransfer) domain-containing protein